MAKICVVYLLHFDEKLKHAQHYCGWTPNGIDQRLTSHLKGTGAKLVKSCRLRWSSDSAGPYVEHGNC
ncbi:hypothetical protein LCGC14_0686690 [marine sediment metagenome]|uniref:GIY-YIG domain-containing protein n=1 Tax=marine sediment metagenome TaxID=412755 RepID=A0A0F9R6Z9_9ZZZZ